ncbi:hypothetical protein [Halalkalicoccus subterraneus]|uniref:hypothetical protein n=1 Tax=Halalkalicoccus subterraneus TaxID=2675002 RepID=UPI0013CECC19|nr:hypothetical protein [Halalkalicoccus subterraneus]
MASIEFNPQSQEDIAGGVLLALVSIGLLMGHWQYGVNWQNPAIMAWLATITVVCVALGIYAFGYITGDIYKNKSTYTSISHILGTIAITTILIFVLAIFFV